MLKKSLHAHDRDLIVLRDMVSQSFFLKIWASFSLTCKIERVDYQCTKAKEEIDETIDLLGTYFEQVWSSFFPFFLYQLFNWFYTH